ncbi:MAG: GNAT family N-acetyltransferase [Casimicrobium sp.]
MRILRPTLMQLASYKAALERGWSPDNLRGAVAAQEMLARIGADADAFLATLEDREAKGPLVTLPDGAQMKRIPGFHRWMWDGEFCGSISLRWKPGTAELPPHVLGHIGYAVVPWKRRLGYATSALKQMLPLAREVGLPYVEITTDLDNVASQRVIEVNGGELVEHFTKPEQFGSTAGLRYRIALV